MPLPEFTHLQLLILGILMDRELPGQSIRDALLAQKVRKSGPAFYQVMARLEDARLVEGRYEQQIIHGQRIRERRYKVTGQGAKAWERARDFYIELAKQLATGAPSYA